MWGIRALCPTFPEECGISGGFVLIQDDGDRSCKDFWVHFGTLERTQVFTSICGIHFIVIEINTWIKKANLEMPMTFCFAAL